MNGLSSRNEWRKENLLERMDDGKSTKKDAGNFFETANDGKKIETMRREFSEFRCTYIEENNENV